MTDEEMAEEYAKANMHYEIAKRENGANYAKEVNSVTIKQAYLAGLKAGKSRWHDLRKDHSDLPESDLTVLDEDGNKITYKEIIKDYLTIAKGSHTTLCGVPEENRTIHVLKLNEKQRNS